MNDADLQAVRQLVIGAFRWVDGHADLSRVFRSADVLSVKGSHHPGASVHVQTAPDWRGRELLLRLHPDALRPTDRGWWSTTPPPPPAVASTCTGCSARQSSQPTSTAPRNGRSATVDDQKSVRKGPNSSPTQ